jgi:hypothetical protein
MHRLNPSASPIASQLKPSTPQIYFHDLIFLHYDWTLTLFIEREEHKLERELRALAFRFAFRKRFVDGFRRTAECRCGSVFAPDSRAED